MNLFDDNNIVNIAIAQAKKKTARERERAKRALVGPRMANINKMATIKNKETEMETD